MTPRRRLIIGISIPLLVIGVVCWVAVPNFRGLVYFALQGTHLVLRPAPPYCKQRAAEFTAKVNLLERDARNWLKVGTKKDAVIRFFASENIPLTFDKVGADQEALGTLFFKGLGECQNIACGDDSKLIGVRVKVDTDGTVLSDPIVVGMYTDCL
jgi:hypothetical protein